MRALRTVAEAKAKGATVTDVHRGLLRGNRWAAMWELDALTAIGIVREDGLSRDEDREAERRYRLGDEWLPLYESVACTHTRNSIKEEQRGSNRRIRIPPDVDPRLHLGDKMYPVLLADATKAGHLTLDEAARSYKIHQLVEVAQGSAVKSPETDP